MSDSMVCLNCGLTKEHEICAGEDVLKYQLSRKVRRLETQVIELTEYGESLRDLVIVKELEVNHLRSRVAELEEELALVTSNDCGGEDL